MAIYQHMAGVAAKLGKDLLEARDIARRAWQSSGSKALAAQWNELSEAEKQAATQHELEMLERYDIAYHTLIANAPALLDKIGDAELFFETRLRLTSALKLEGIPYPATPNPAAAAMDTSEEDQEWEATIARMNPNELQCMESPLKQVERLMRMPVTTSWTVEKTSILAPEKQALAQMCNQCFRAMSVCTCGDEAGWTEEKEAGYRCEECGRSIAVCECEKFYAEKDPFSDNYYCPFCNSVCAPDYCFGCHSPLDRLGA